jgi:PrtD family type I secretion system ABC transporter
VFHIIQNVSLIVISAIVVFGVCEAIRGVLAQRLSARFATEVADDMFDKLVKSKNPQLNKQQLLRDFNQVRNFLSTRQAIGIFDLPFAPLFLLLMFLLNVYLGALALVGITLLVIVALVNKRMTDGERAHSGEKSGEALNFAQAVLQRSDDISAMGLMPNLMERWGDKTAAALNSADKASSKGAAFFGLSKFVRQTLQVLIMALGAYLVLDGQISGGMIFAASMISSRALMPIEQIIGSWAAFSQARDSYGRIEGLLGENEGDGSEKPTSLPTPRGVISVENLVYSPSEDPNAKPIINDVSFSLQPGTIMAVIGASGSGKSTIARLLVSAIPPTSGAIRLDGFELENWDDYTRGRVIGYVPQDISLFPGTIAENISRMEVNPNDRKLIEAAQTADVHEMISKLPEGYQTKIGGGGLRLSGGQRQRIALARAFYTSPRVLVLDEPNAHLDTQGEEKLLQTLMRAKQQGLTVLAVTQRQNLLKIADVVLRVEEGQASIVQPGTRQKKGMQDLKKLLDPKGTNGADRKRAKPANDMAGKFADLNKKLAQTNGKPAPANGATPPQGAM